MFSISKDHLIYKSEHTGRSVEYPIETEMSVIYDNDMGMVLYVLDSRTARKVFNEMKQRLIDCNHQAAKDLEAHLVISDFCVSEENIDEINLCMATTGRAKDLCLRLNTADIFNTLSP